MVKKTFLITLLLLQTFAWSSVVEGRYVESPGYIRIKGSDTMAALAESWKNVYQSQTTGVTMEVSSGGSGNGIAALINGHVEIANTSRPLKSQEIRLMMRRSGKKPVVFMVGLDAVSVIIHPLNPLNGLSLKQLAEIYGRNGKIRRWSELGVKVPSCEDKEIIQVSRKNNSGTYSFFRRDIFPKRRHFHLNMEFVETSDAVVKRVTETPCAIGYSGMGFVTATVKTLCIIKNDGPCVPPTAAFTLDKSYPLARPLYMVTQGAPSDQIKRYLEWVTGPDGQEILRKSGFIPIPSAVSMPITLPKTEGN